MVRHGDCTSYPNRYVTVDKAPDDHLSRHQLTAEDEGREQVRIANTVLAPTQAMSEWSDSFPDCANVAGSLRVKC